jgi:hypothetical protein
MACQEIKLLSLAQSDDLVVGILVGVPIEIEPYLEAIEAMLTQRYQKQTLLIFIPICELGCEQIGN